MRCPKCKQTVPNDLTFCTNCGYKFESYLDGDDDYVPNPAPARNNAFLYVILGVVLFILVATTALVVADRMGWSLWNRSDSSDDAATEEITVSSTVKPENTATPTANVTDTPTPTTSVAPDSDEYLLPESDKRKMTDADLASLTHEELCFARNEIYARHGRMFDTPEVRSYFESKSWYHGTIAANRFDESDLSDVERANVNIIFSYEKQHYGGSYY